MRRIFTEYVGYESPRDIAHDLNKAGIAPPRGESRNASTINGNLQRGHGVLLNEIYVGRIVWNKVRMIKNSTTKKRISRPTPPINGGLPRRRTCGSLAMIFGRRRKRETRKADDGGLAKPRLHKQRPILAGLVRCGICGGSMVSSDRFGTYRI